DRAYSFALPPRSAPVATPAGLQAELRGYQREGVAWLQHLRAHDAGGVLADDMGLGKTLQTIAHILIEKEAGRLGRPVLVVAPTSLVGNWGRELAKFAPALTVTTFHGTRRELGASDVVITTYGVLVHDRETLASRDWHLLVLDEAHAIKTHDTLA